MSGFCVCSVAKVKVGVWPISAQPLAGLGQEAGHLCGAGAILSEARVSLWHLTCDLDVLTFEWNLSLASTAGGLTQGRPWRLGFQKRAQAWGYPVLTHLPLLPRAKTHSPPTLYHLPGHRPHFHRVKPSN